MFYTLILIVSAYYFWYICNFDIINIFYDNIINENKKEINDNGKVSKIENSKIYG